MISFFRKYQRPLLLTAAIFALVTFSVTGAMLTAVQQCSERPGDKLPRLTLPSGKDYQVTWADSAMAHDVYQYFVIRGRFLDIGLFKEGLDESQREREREHAYDRILILMCAARDAGIGVSDRLVADFARNLRIPDMGSYEQAIAQIFQAESVARFEAALVEYFRIKYYIDALALGENLSIQSVLEEAAKEGEELRAELVRFRAEDHEPGLKQETVEDARLLEFLAGLESGEKTEFLDRKLVDLELAWIPAGTTVEDLKQSMAALNPAEKTPGRVFLEDLDKLPEIADPLVERRYDQDKASLYAKSRPAAESRPASEPASRPAGEEPKSVDPEETQDYLPLDEALKEKIRASLKLERALGLAFAQVKAAALEKGKEFDQAAFLQATFPFLKVTRTGLQRSSNLAKLPPLEGWALYHEAEGPAEGEFCPNVYNSKTAHFFARVAAVKENEPRPIAEIRDSLKSLYVKKESRARAEKAAKEFIAKLREMGRQAAPEEVARIDKQIAEAVEKRLADRKTELEASQRRIEAVLADGDLPARFRPEYEATLARTRAELEALPEKGAAFKKEEQEKLESELLKVELKDAGTRFAAAAEALGARLARVDFFPRNLNQLDRDAVEEESDEGIKYLKSYSGVARLAELEPGAVTEPIEDHASRSFLVLHLAERRNRDFSTLTPGEVQERLQARRRAAAGEFAAKALSFEALRTRHNYRNFSQEEEYKARLEQAPASAPASKAASQPPAGENPGNG